MSHKSYFSKKVMIFLFSGTTQNKREKYFRDSVPKICFAENAYVLYRYRDKYKGIMNLIDS